MPTFLPRDHDNNPIPALRVKRDAAHHLTVSGSSTRNTTAFDEDTKIIGLYADVPVYIAFGDETVTATISDHYFPAGLYYDIAIRSEKGGSYSHMAVICADEDGTLHISEKE